MITLKSAREIESMRVPNQIVAECHRVIADMIKPGVTTLEIDEKVEALILKHGAVSATKGYKGYQFATCASVNDVIAHGFPDRTPLKEGDIVTIDISLHKDGWYGDSGWCYAVGSVSDEAAKLMRVTKECLDIGVRNAFAGNRIGDVMHALQTHAEANGYSVVRDLLAHGIGRALHEEPSIVHIGKPGKGFRLKPGMTFTIEPMINQGTFHMTIDADGWTARTADGKLSAQYEHTIAITGDGPPLILTEQ